MPVSSACCQKDIQANQSAAVYKDVVVVPPPSMEVFELPDLSSVALAQSLLPSHSFDTSPPLSPAATSSILRI